VEQNSDLTYRLDDFGRAGLNGKFRPLHLDKGLDVTRIDRSMDCPLPLFEFRERYGSRRFILANRHFALEELRLEIPATFSGSPERIELLTALSGSATLEAAGVQSTCQPGNTWLVPPATREYGCIPQGKARWLKFYVPDLDRDFRQPLARRGLSSAEIDRIVFD
jgi:mannose-6-phosphate isomerase class I